MYEVFKQLGGIFLEKVYEYALFDELQAQGLQAESRVEVKVFYKGTVVGEYVAYVVVKDRVILELKAQQQL